jgi:hypothetical protein
LFWLGGETWRLVCPLWMGRQRAPNAEEAERQPKNDEAEDLEAAAALALDARPSWLPLGYRGKSRDRAEVLL